MDGGGGGGPGGQGGGGAVLLGLPLPPGGDGDDVSGGHVGLDPAEPEVMFWFLQVLCCTFKVFKQILHLDLNLFLHWLLWKLRMFLDMNILLHRWHEYVNVFSSIEPLASV